MAPYELQSLNLPRLTGAGLKAFASALENPAGRALLLDSLMQNGGIPKLRRTRIDEPPTLFPLVAPAERPAPVPFEPGAQPEGFPFRTILDYAAAYRSGQFSPEQAAEKALAAIRSSEQDNPALRAFISIKEDDVMAQARAAAQRHAAGSPLGPLDGVPVAVKDEVDMLPHPTTVGTRILGGQPASTDATVVERLRRAGALLVGKTNMHEIGINPNGANPHHGATRNPYNTACDTGGSSTGSGTAVAAGLVPAAIGADGGGSIRIPAALCGVVGLKATYGRISEAGAAPLCWSVAHLGPLAASVEDAALVYSVIAGPDPRDPNSLLQPPPTLSGWNRKGLSGLRMGIYRAWFEHASPEVVQACYTLVEEFKRAGAEVVEVEIPELDEMRIAHAITILSEMAACMQAHRARRKEMAAASRINLVMGEQLSSNDYIQAQRMRTRAMRIFAEAFQQVDVILTPGTALAAQPVPSGGYSDGWSDLGTDTEMMRFIYTGNLTGMPGITFPAGYDGRGLPISMQAIGRHWEEHLLLRVAYNAEQVVARRLPPRWYGWF